jgi:hypothetical protein
VDFLTSNYGVEDDVTQLLDKTELIIVPFTNPDGCAAAASLPLSACSCTSVHFCVFLSPAPLTAHRDHCALSLTDTVIHHHSAPLTTGTSLTTTITFDTTTTPHHSPPHFSTSLDITRRYYYPPLPTITRHRSPSLLTHRHHHSPSTVPAMCIRGPTSGCGARTARLHPSAPHATALTSTAITTSSGARADHRPTHAQKRMLRPALYERSITQPHAVFAHGRNRCINKQMHYYRHRRYCRL